MKISYNLLGVLTGVAMLSTCSFIAFMFQKFYFNKYKNKVKNVMSKKPK